MQKEVFCANEQQITTHDAMVDNNGEFVFTCVECGRFVKFPSDSTKEELSQLIQDHQEVNTGQVSLEAQNRLLEEFVQESGDIQPTPPQAVNSEAVEASPIAAETDQTP